MTDPVVVASVIGLVGAVLAAGVAAVGVIVAKLIGRLRGEVADQIAPNGGNRQSTRHLIEQTWERIGRLESDAQDSRDRSIRAETLAEQTSARLDTHLLGHPARD